MSPVQLAVVMPWLAQAFPKEIAVDATGVRAAFWSGRDGRELDFRSETLIRDYWQDWPRDLHIPADELARIPSNAQGAARTHDVWLLPHRSVASIETIRAQAVAAARPVLVTVDPVHFCRSEAIGWPMHPLDEDRFPVEEQYIREFWARLAASRGYNGFLAWGANPVSARRVSGGVDYGMRRHVWGLYGRSGSREYHEFGKRYNRFLGDWEIAHWTAGKKFKGGFNVTHVQRPHYWASESHMVRPNNSAHDIYNWLLDYYMTGDEAALEIVRRVGEAMLEHWDLSAARWGTSPVMNLRILTTLFIREWDERFLRLAEELLESAGWVDLESPNGLTDNMRHGALSKVDRNVLTLIDYVQATGDAPARQAVLKAVDFQYRFDRIPPPVSYQNAAGLLLTIAHRWTGNDHYLRRVRHLVDSTPYDPAPDAGPHANMHATLGLPSALALLAKTDAPRAPYPLAEVNDETGTVDILFEVPDAGQPLRIALFARFDGGEDRTVRVHPFDPAQPDREMPPVELRVVEEPMFKNPAAARFEISLPAGMPRGLYRLSVPNARRIVVQESDIERWSIHAPEGFLANWDRPYYFRVAEGIDQIEMNLGRPMTIRGPDGEVLIEADPREIGRLSIPAADRAGVWTVHAPAWGFFRLLNGEPVFAAGTPEALVSRTGLRPATWVEPPSPEDRFVPGAHEGLRALYLAGSTSARFALDGLSGEEKSAFPSREGTVEFWVRPNGSSGDRASASHLLEETFFFRTGSHELRYRSGAGRAFRLPFLANLSFSVFGEAGETGFIGRHFFRAGEWVHVAACWRLQEDGGLAPAFRLFLNGVRMNEAAGSPFYGASVYGYGGRPIFPRRPEPGLPGALLPAEPAVTIGPIDGAIAQLRVSDTVRYDTDFEPQWDLSRPVEGRVVFFPLDGSLAGQTADGRRLELEPQ